MQGGTSPYATAEAGRLMTNATTAPERGGTNLPLLVARARQRIRRYSDVNERRTAAQKARHIAVDAREALERLGRAALLAQRLVREPLQETQFSRGAGPQKARPVALEGLVVGRPRTMCASEAPQLEMAGAPPAAKRSTEAEGGAGGSGSLRSRTCARARRCECVWAWAGRVRTTFAGRAMRCVAESPVAVACEGRWRCCHAFVLRRRSAKVLFAGRTAAPQTRAPLHAAVHDLHPARWAPYSPRPADRQAWALAGGVQPLRRRGWRYHHFPSGAPGSAPWAGCPCATVGWLAAPTMPAFLR